MNNFNTTVTLYINYNQFLRANSLSFILNSMIDIIAYFIIFKFIKKKLTTFSFKKIIVNEDFIFFVLGFIFVIFMNYIMDYHLLKLDFMHYIYFLFVLPTISFILILSSSPVWIWIYLGTMYPDDDDETEVYAPQKYRKTCNYCHGAGGFYPEPGSQILSNWYEYHKWRMSHSGWQKCEKCNGAGGSEYYE